MAQYVILYHQCPAGGPRASHWDLMLQRGEALRTWALPENPADHDEMTCEALAEHRLEYLTYEGAISGGRGQVTRWDQGTYTIVEEGDGRIELVLAGVRLRGPVTLTRTPDSAGRWQFRSYSVRPAT